MEVLSELDDDLVGWLVAGGSAVVALLSGLVARRRARRRKALRDRSVKVMVVGLPESGKTALLASMFRRLAYGGPDGVLVETDRATTGQLLALTRAMEHRDEEVPAGTLLDDTTNYEFTFLVTDDGGGHVRPCGVSYLDYAGEHAGPLVRPGTTEPAPEVMAAAARSDVLMGILDGQRVVRMMEGQADEDFFTELGDLILLLARAPQKAAHLIITKWDVVHPRFSLADVVARLDLFPPFRQFRGHRRHGVLRVIPVSSFGMNGYLFRDAEGVVCKSGKPDLHWDPYNVATPLAFALRDVMTGNTSRASEGRANRRRRVREFSHFFVAVGALLGMISVQVPLLSFGAVEFVLKRNGLAGLAAVADRPQEVEDRVRRPQQRSVLRVLSFLDRLTANGASIELTQYRRSTV
ncbi:hypothetical protein [Umezawaea tangerina]|uniref:Uncharacterized protein n=1 Tax=Umezawaea tangerina TaxID=84725 RepID=A0A2T0TAN9_9PSEU|nr:hypothetical protein [Umezawaea tangerina]PRY42714.1 hypothetical protein CLV43_104549 [Umezawaea tangerina]